MNVPFRIDLTTSRHRRRLVVHGEFDIARVGDFERLADAIADPGCAVRLDLRSTTIVDSSALGALIRLRRRVMAEGSEVEVVVAPGWQEQLMHQAGLRELLAVRVVARDVDDGSAS
jgi:anti-anti-sigma factor